MIDVAEPSQRKLRVHFVILSVCCINTGSSSNRVIAGSSKEFDKLLNNNTPNNE